MALSEKAAATTQFREPGWTTPSASETRQESAPVFGAYLFARLWTDGSSSQRGAAFGDSGSPAASLAMDLVKASAGVAVQSRGDVLSAGFQTLPQAISAARRMQWAVQGISESAFMQGNSVALLIQSGAEGDGNQVPQVLDLAAPGQIMLSDKVCQLFENLPGLPLQTTGDKRLKELLWRVPDDQATPSADEQSYAELLGMQGLEYHPPEEFAPVFAAVEAQAPIRESHEPSGGAAGILELLRGNPKWVMGGAGAVVVLLGALTIPHLFSGKSAAPTIPPPASTETSATDSSSVPSATSSSPAGGTPSKTPSVSQEQGSNKRANTAANQGTGSSKGKADKDNGRVPVFHQDLGKEPVQQQVVITPPPPKAEPPRSRSCEMDGGEIAGILDQAEKSASRGKYDVAIRQFNSVLGCEPNNARARDGLQKVKSAKEAEN